MASREMIAAAEKSIEAGGSVSDAIDVAIRAQVESKAINEWLSVGGRSVVVGEMLRFFGVEPE